MQKQKCCWVLEGYVVGKPAKYCLQPVKYKIIKDDDGNNKRKYEVFCPEHKEKAEAEIKKK